MLQYPNTVSFLRKVGDLESLLSQSLTLKLIRIVAIACGVQFISAHFDEFFVTGDDVPNVTAVSRQGKLATTWATIKQSQ